MVMNWTLAFCLSLGIGAFSESKTANVQAGIEISVMVDSCVDTHKIVAIGDESMHAYVPMVIRISNHSGKDYRFELKGFFEMIGLQDEKGRSARFLPQEMRSPHFASDSSSYLVRDGETATIHLASAIFWNYDIKPDKWYEARLHYQWWPGRNVRHQATFFRGQLDSAPFQFKTCP
jgi:hypothetical protein